MFHVKPKLGIDWMFHVKPKFGNRLDVPRETKVGNRLDVPRETMSICWSRTSFYPVYEEIILNKLL